MCTVWFCIKSCVYYQKNTGSSATSGASRGATGGITILSEKKLFLGQKVNIYQLHLPVNRVTVSVVSGFYLTSCVHCGSVSDVSFSLVYLSQLFFHSFCALCPSPEVGRVETGRASVVKHLEVHGWACCLHISEKGPAVNQRPQQIRN